MREILRHPPAAPLLLCLLLSLAGVTVLPSPSPAAVSPEGLALVRESLDRGQPQEALALLTSMSKGRPQAEELLLRGMARVMLGEIKEGAADLEEAVDKNPKLRDGWLNLAGLEIAEANYEEALRLLRKAEELAPEQPDIHLNLGAVLLMLGRQDEAAGRFDRYLGLDASAQGLYLVAANFALVGDEEKAVDHLRRAISLDERLRLRARRDERFSGLDSLDYRVALHTDGYEPPQGHHQAAAAFGVAYSQREPKLLYAVMDALKELNLPFDPEIETTARWALIWGPRMRIKVHTQSNGTGVVSVSASPSQFKVGDWQRTTDQLFRTLHQRLGG